MLSSPGRRAAPAPQRPARRTGGARRPQRRALRNRPLQRTPGAVDAAFGLVVGRPSRRARARSRGCVGHGHRCGLEPSP